MKQVTAPDLKLGVALSEATAWSADFVNRVW